MDVANEVLETGPDYQKAKRSAFLISFITLALAFSSKKSPGEPTVKILDVEISQPLASLLAVLLLCVIYCAYNFYIHQKRAFLEHTEAVRSYGDVTVIEALSNLTTEVVGILDLVRNAKSTLNNAEQTQPYDQTIEPDNKVAKWVEGSIYESRKSFDSEVMSAKNKVRSGDMGANAAADYIVKITRNYTELLERDLINSGSQIMGQEISRCANDLKNKAGQQIIALERVAEGNIPEIKMKIEALQTGLSLLSDKIEPREKAFFAVETWVVRIILSVAACSAVVRIIRDAIPS